MRPPLSLGSAENSCRVSTPLDNTIYFEKLVESVTRIVRHAYYPGKDEAIELCLEEIDDLQDMGRITLEQRAALRELLLGQEDRGLVEGVIREREHPEAIEGGERIAVFCEGAGSLAAFSAGVLQGLLEHAGDHGEIVALGGTAFGSISALLAWDGLLRRRFPPRRRPAPAVLARLFRGLADRRPGELLDSDGAPSPHDGPAARPGTARGLVTQPGSAPPAWWSARLIALTPAPLAAGEGAPGLAVSSVDCWGRIGSCAGTGDPHGSDPRGRDVFSTCLPRSPPRTPKQEILPCRPRRSGRSSTRSPASSG